MGVRRVLYRCPTPTNFLCPCGAAERRLRRIGLEHETRRVPYNRRARPEITDLTGQRRVPVLIDGEEVVHDSRRILQYLEWAYPGEISRPRRRRLRGLWRWRRRSVESDTDT